MPRQRHSPGSPLPWKARATALLERISGRPLARVQTWRWHGSSLHSADGCSEDAPVDQMSAGEQEQIYFATRLALAEVLSEKERQVLVLDDPLVNTDTERLARVLELIAEKIRPPAIRDPDVSPGPLHRASQCRVEVHGPVERGPGGHRGGAVMRRDGTRLLGVAVALRWCAVSAFGLVRHCRRFSTPRFVDPQEDQDGCTARRQRGQHLSNGCSPLMF